MNGAGDHVGRSAHDSPNVTRLTFSPSASISQICGDPERSDVNAICVPVGDQVGDASAAELFVIGVTRKNQHWRGLAGCPTVRRADPTGTAGFARYLPDVRSNRLKQQQNGLRAAVTSAGGRYAHRRL